MFPLHFTHSLLTNQHLLPVVLEITEAVAGCEGQLRPTQTLGVALVTGQGEGLLASLYLS